MRCWWGEWHTQVGVNDIELQGRVRANILLDLKGKPRIGGLQVSNNSFSMCLSAVCISACSQDKLACVSQMAKGTALSHQSRVGAD